MRRGCRAGPRFLHRHPRESGDPVLQCIPRRRTHWVPASAGMTGRERGAQGFLFGQPQRLKRQGVPGGGDFRDGGGELGPGGLRVSAASCSDSRGLFERSAACSAQRVSPRKPGPSVKPERSGRATARAPSQSEPPSGTPCRPREAEPQRPDPERPTQTAAAPAAPSDSTTLIAMIHRYPATKAECTEPRTALPTCSLAPAGTSIAASLAL